MTAVMLSIRPEWCALIAQGKKTIEVRKNRPKLETPFKCYIYCTKAKKVHHCGCLSIADDELFRTQDGEIELGWSGKLMCSDKPYSKDNFLNGKVIGEFVCGKIQTYRNVATDNWESLLGNCHENEKEQLARKALLSESQVHKYANGKNLYGWHISDLVIYDKPKEITEFTPWAGEVPGRKLKRPPQSWCYVEEVEK